MGSTDILSQWIKLNSNGDWEHENGVHIQTLDNPGWVIKIDLVDTLLENAECRLKHTGNEQDWMDIQIEEKVFIGMGDLSKFEAIVSEFLKLVVNATGSGDFQYEIYLPFSFNNIAFWILSYAKLVDMHHFEILDVCEDISLIRCENVADTSLLSLKEFKDFGINFKSRTVVSFGLKKMYSGITLVAL